MIYFDHNASSPMLAEARQAWVEAAENFPGNPSSPHRIGSRAEAALERARETIAGYLGCSAGDLVFTSGATESNNLVMHQFRAGEGEVWVSAIEHPSVMEAARFWLQGRMRKIPVNREGVVEVGWIGERLKRERPSLVAVMAANNETGVVQGWREIATLCREREVPFFCDGTQWLGKRSGEGLGRCDYMSGSAHKFGGARGIGFLKCPEKGGFEGMLRGGPQEGKRRGGTENVAGVISMAVALARREEQMREEGGRVEEMRRRFERKLLGALPGVEIVGAGAERLWNTVMALMPEVDCQQRWVVKLDKLGYAVSTGSACASGKEVASAVLLGMGYEEKEASRSLRFSSGWETSEEEWNGLCEALVKVHHLLSRREKS